MSTKTLKQLVFGVILCYLPLTNFAQCENENGSLEDYLGTPLENGDNTDNNEAITDDLTNWFVSHGSPNIKHYDDNNWLAFYSSVTPVFSEGVYTEHDFIDGETYTVSYKLYRDSPERPDSRVFVKLTNGLTPSAGDVAIPTVATSQLVNEHEWEETGLWFGTGPSLWSEITTTFTATENFSQLWFYTEELAASGVPFSLAAIDDVCIETVILETDPCDFTPTFSITAEECIYSFENTTVYPTDPDFIVESVNWDLADGVATGDNASFEYYPGETKIICMTIMTATEGDSCLKTICDTIMVDSTCGSSSILEFERPKTINVYPNPNNGIFTISSTLSDPIQHFSIFDASGRLVEQITNVEQPSKMLIDLSAFDSGIYLVTVYTEKTSTPFTLKVSVE